MFYLFLQYFPDLKKIQTYDFGYTCGANYGYGLGFEDPYYSFFYTLKPDLIKIHGDLS
jgi:hypothetical protein